jgi:diguanylate cyclase (GGDEF)-like protein
MRGGRDEPGDRANPGAEVLERLLEVSRALLESLDPKEVVRLIERALRDLVPHDTLIVAEVDWQSRRWSPTFAQTRFKSGDSREAFLASSYSIDEGIAGWAIVNGEAVNVIDAHLDPRAFLVPGTENTESQMVVVPLVREGRVLGALSIARLGGPGLAFTELEFNVIKAFAALAAIALGNASIHDAARAAADTDPVTGLRSRVAFDRDLDGLVMGGRRFGLIVLDLDRFKSYNDVHGHPAGDELLHRVGEAMARSCRPGDHAYRSGGDEFAILLGDAGARAAATISDRLRRSIAAATASRLPHVTASMGLAIFPEAGASASALLSAADRALYDAKRSRPADQARL